MSDDSRATRFTKWLKKTASDVLPPLHWDQERRERSERAQRDIDRAKTANEASIVLIAIVKDLQEREISCSYYEPASGYVPGFVFYKYEGLEITRVQQVVAQHLKTNPHISIQDICSNIRPFDAFTEAWAQEHGFTEWAHDVPGNCPYCKRIIVASKQFRNGPSARGIPIGAVELMRAPGGACIEIQTPACEECLRLLHILVTTDRSPPTDQPPTQDTRIEDSPQPF